MVVGEKATHRNWMPDPQDLAEFENKTFPYPANFEDDYVGRRAALEQDMTIDKTMLMHDDLKIGVDYSKRGMFGRMSPEEKAAYKAYYDRAEESYSKIKHDPKEVVKWKYQRYMRDYLACVDSVDESVGKLLEYLDGLGIRPGARLQMLARNYDETVTLKVDRKSVQIGRAHV